jgi:hypothetical protein
LGKFATHKSSSPGKYSSVLTLQLPNNSLCGLMVASKDASDSSPSSSESTSRDSKKAFIKAFFLFLLKEVFFFKEKEEAGGRRSRRKTLETEEASLTEGRKTSGVKRVRGAFEGKF